MRRLALALGFMVASLTQTICAQNAVPKTNAPVAACLRQLLLPDARLTPIRKTPEGYFATHVLTVEDWIDAVAKRGSAAFYEVQVKASVEQYGHFAHLWSTYEIRDTPDGKASVKGINSIQAVFDGTNWKVFSILWEPDTTAGPLPEKYLP